MAVGTRTRRSCHLRTVLCRFISSRQPFPYPITELNRMIGGRQPDASKEYTFTSLTFFKADSPLVPFQIIQSGEM